MHRPRSAPPPAPDAAPRRRARHIPLVLLLGATAALYLYGLADSGWGNAFYAAAAQAGGQSWSAWFFGASDAAGGITVDKAPGALWVMGLSVRLFGLSSWSVLVPQALMGVGAVALLHATVRRVSGDAAGLLAGAVLALTPVAVLMFRYDNPDALLVLVLTGAAYATTRAVEPGARRATGWLVLAGALVGAGFMAKMLQAFLVLPALTAVWLLAAPVAWWPRIRALAAAGAAVLVSAGWWVLVVELWPADARPWIGGSQTNSVLELVLGYNGVGRLTGDEVGSVGGNGGWGETGLLRLFGAQMSREASWLLPAALLLLGVLLWRTRGARRGGDPDTSALRAATVLWGGWLLVTGLTFSLMAGIIHGYYTVALAPAIGALVGTGAVTLWRDRAATASRMLLAATVAVTALWSWVLLGGAADWLPWLRWTLLGAGLLAAAALTGVHRLARVPAAVVVTAALLAGLGGSAAWSVATAATPHTGAIPSSGPAGYGAGPGGRAPGGNGPGGGAPGRPGGGPTGGLAGTGTGGTTGGTGTSGTGTSGGTGTAGGGTAGGTTGSGTAGGSASTGGAGPAGAGPGNTGPAGGGPGRGGGPGGGGPGGILGSPTPSAQLTALLQRDAGSYTWVAAAVGSNQAAGYQLASGSPVLALGGFNGTDPYPSPEAFRRLVAEGRVHWFVGGSGAAANADTGGSDAAARIAAWVEQTFPARTVDGVTVYDLTGTPR